VADRRAATAAARVARGVRGAEWAYLTRPDRLRALVSAHAELLQLVELAPSHFGEAAMVAYPPEPDELTPTGGAQ
jgi:hypothetical protein